MAEVTGETVNQGNTGETQEHTFTQAEVNAIISDRVARERAKYADYDTMKDKAAKYDEVEEASKTELQKEKERADSLKNQLDRLTRANSIREVRTKVAKETGVPADILSGEDEESCKTQAQAILEFAKAKTGFPTVQDSGEITTPGVKQKNRDVFAAYMNDFLKR